MARSVLVAGPFLVLGASALAGAARAADHVVGGTQLTLRRSAGYPACGGGCTDAGFTCRAIEGKCACLP
jgi:hypothetical protein